MKKIMFILVIIVSCYGCKKDNYSSSLIGEWSWISTCGLSGKDCLTPTSTHTSRNLVFTSDSHYYVYDNDTLSVSSKFNTYESFSEDGKCTGYIKYDYDSGSTDMFSVTNDTLSLENLYGIIAYVSLYKRIIH